MQLIKIKKALISVSDKTNLKEVLECLKINNIEISVLAEAINLLKILDFNVPKYQNIQSFLKY